MVAKKSNLNALPHHRQGAFEEPLNLREHAAIELGRADRAEKMTGESLTE
jgi:hypothetical protein